MPAYDIINVEGVPVAFIGVVTQSAAGMVMPEGIKNIEFTDEVTAVNKAAEEPQEKRREGHRGSRTYVSWTKRQRHYR